MSVLPFHTFDDVGIVGADRFEVPDADDEILRTLDLLCPGAPVEIRVLLPPPAPDKPNTMVVEHFTDHRDAADFVRQHDPSPRTKAIYTPLNPFDPERIAATGVDNASVTRRRWFLIDADPVRPTADMNSTEAEHAAAFAISARMTAFLTSLGAPDGVGADSGNGSHLVYPIDLPNDPASLDLLKRALRGLATKFDTPAVHIDQTVGNAGRITKLYGTMTRKGPASSERPHRRSGLRHVPTTFAPLPVEVLQRLADLAPSTESTSTRESAPRSSIYDVGQILLRLEVFKTYKRGDVTYYEIRCPWQHEHTSGPSGTIFTVNDNGALGFKCQHAHCVDRHWPELRDWLGITTPRVETIIEDFHAFMARMDTQPKLAWHIDGLIPDEGTCLWHGQPRDFKSMCALEVALALATGRPAFACDRFAVRRSVKVAYFTEEDPERLFAARLHWLTVKNPEPAPGFFFQFVRKGLSFDVDTDRNYILATLRAIGAEVAVFDPARSYTGFSDKGPADLRPVALFLRQIQNTTTAKTLVLVHHDTKPLANANGDPRTRSQQASGGGIFSISDCPVAFTKLAWNQVAVYPEDYKLSGDPQPFEVTFQTDARDGGVDGPRFGSWVRPVAVTKEERDIVDGAAARKILTFLRGTAGQWHSTVEVNDGAHLRTNAAGAVLKRLGEEGKVRFCTGDAALALGRKKNAHLWTVDRATAGDVGEPMEPEPA